MNSQRIARILVGISLVLLPFGTVHAKTAAKTVAKPVVTKKAPAKKVVAKKSTKKNTKKVSKICAECKSKAEGADKSAAARAESWTGTVIGINEGENSYVITEATVLNHIKAFAQRSVRVSSETELVHNGEPFDFAKINVGARVTVWGTYNAAKRTISATRVEAKNGVQVVATAGN